MHGPDYWAWMMGELSLLVVAAIPVLCPTAPQLVSRAKRSETKQGPEDSVAKRSPGAVASSGAGEQSGPGLGGRVATTCSPSRGGWSWREGTSGALCWPGGSRRKEVAAAAGIRSSSS